MIMVSRSWAWLILVGVCLAAVGILFNFELEHSFRALTISQFFFLEYTYFPMLIFGLLTTLVASVMWSRRVRSLILALTGAVVIGLTLLVSVLVPFNIHGWSGSFMSVYVVALLIGLLFLVLAAVRFISAQLSLKK